MEFAVIKTGGKQYIAEPGKKLKIEKIEGVAGDAVFLHDVLLAADGAEVAIGTPTVAGAAVEAKILKQGRAKKIIVFKYHAKTRYRKKRGHRQPYTEVEILGIKAPATVR